MAVCILLRQVSRSISQNVRTGQSLLREAQLTVSLEAEDREPVRILDGIRSCLLYTSQSNGYETVAPENFSDVIDRIKAEQPHLILLDIKLPGTSGFSLCTEIRTFSEVPIIFVTSCNTDMDELNSIMLGGDAFITKPYNTAILLDVYKRQR